LSSLSSDDNESQDQQLELGDDDSAVALKKAWEKTLRALISQYNKPTFENFLRPLKPLSYDGKIVVLGAPSAFAREWAEKKYTQTLKTHLSIALDVADIQVRFVISSPDVQPLLGVKPIDLQVAASPAIHEEDPEPKPGNGRHGKGAMTTLIRQNPFLSELTEPTLNDKYIFDHFVVGRSNRLAHAGALAVAKAPGKSYNPLFLYGSPGLGKTHLMHAIGHQVQAELPEANVVYVSGETFTNHFVSALRERRTEDFRRAYRNVDVWLVDDIQTIASKEQTKEEFFHTFNTLHQMNKQIVISSDRSPRELRTMDERLVSRFECGLTADIAAPDLEMRMAILQKKAVLDNMRVPDEVIAYMANLIQSNIRALEGALIKLMAYASLAKSPVTKQLASDVLSSYFVERTPSVRALVSAHPEDYQDQEIAGRPDVIVENIIEAVALQLNVDKNAIMATGDRRKEVMFARQAAMYLCRELSSVPMTTLASTFSCKNHSTISHAHSKMKAQLNADPRVLSTLSRIRRVIEYSL
jgi:chromosomal replication initiator protein